GMRMKADRRHVLRVDVEIIQEHERLDQLADVRRTDQPRDRPMRMPARTVGDAARTRFHHQCFFAPHVDCHRASSYLRVAHRGSLYLSISTIAPDDRCSTAFHSIYSAR